MSADVRKLVWKARLALQRKTMKNFLELQELQWQDPEQTRELQQLKLRQLLIHSYRHVPYYRQVLADVGVANRSGRIRMECFNQIPLMDKATIRHRYEDLKSGDLASRKWYENSSGGSTGEPVRFIQDRDYDAMLGAVKMMDDLWSGYALGEKKTVLWGSERDIFAGREKYRTLLGRWLRNETWFNAFRMTLSQMQTCAEQINDLKPVQILAYVGTIYELSRYIRLKGIKIHGPKAIMTTAGELQSPMRETIESVFSSPVFNRYGSREVGDIACECDHHKGLHVAAPIQYLEILRGDGTEAPPGEIGEIVITNLTNYAMPLIRYRIGDMGTWASELCTCGRGWPILQTIAGRVSDTFLMRDGTRIYGGYFTRLFYFRDWIRKFQVVQEDYDRIHIDIAPYHVGNGSRSSKPKADQEVAEIIEKIRVVMGEGCSVSYAFVDDIVPSPSGKYRYTISKLTA